MYKFRIESEIQHAYPSITKALDAAGIAYYIKNERLEYVHANSNFLLLFEFKEILHKTDFDLYIPSIAHELSREEEILFTTEIESVVDAVVITKDKQEKVLNITRSIYKEGSNSFLIGIVNDVTEHKQKEQFKAYKQVLTKEETYEKLLNRFSSYIFNNTEEQTILDGVCKLCIDLLDLEDISLFILNKATQKLEERAFLNNDNTIVYAAYNPLELELGEGIVGSAAKNMEAVLLSDVSKDDRYIKGAVINSSELAVPIIYKKNLLGVINAEHTDKKHFNNRHQRILEGIAGLLAIKLNELESLAKLEKQNAQLHAFVKDAPVRIAILDKELNFLECSESWFEYSVFDRNILGKNVREVYSGLDKEWLLTLEKAKEGETCFLERVFLKGKNNERQWINAAISPWKDDEGAIGGVMIHIEQITDQVNNEKQLDQKSVELAAARKLAKLFTWDFDPTTGEFTWSSGDEITSLKADSLEEVGTFFDAIDHEFKDEFKEKLNSAIETHSGFEMIHPITLHEKKHWVRTIGEVYAENGEIQKIHGTAQDISEQKINEFSLKLKNEELKRVNEELDQFVYKTAHDLRAPLTNLAGLIGVMREENNPELLKTYFDLQEKSIEKMDAFIMKISHFTRNSRLPIQNERIHFGSLIDEVLSDYLFFNKSEIVQKKVNINLNHEVYSDKERLRSILSNLVSNAIKFADINKDDPSIEISIESSSTDVVIKVKDNGLGISEKSLPKVFDMFYRGHKASEGSGIGLYIVKAIVEKLNGKISLNSKESKGTEIEVVLPNLHPSLKENDPTG